jgi:hypothetical protein
MLDSEINESIETAKELCAKVYSRYSNNLLPGGSHSLIQNSNDVLVDLFKSMEISAGREKVWEIGVGYPFLMFVLSILTKSEVLGTDINETFSQLVLIAKTYSSNIQVSFVSGPPKPAAKHPDITVMKPATTHLVTTAVMNTPGLQSVPRPLVTTASGPPKSAATYPVTTAVMNTPGLQSVPRPLVTTTASGQPKPVATTHPVTTAVMKPATTHPVTTAVATHNVITLATTTKTVVNEEECLMHMKKRKRVIDDDDDDNDEDISNKENITLNDMHKTPIYTQNDVLTQEDLDFIEKAEAEYAQKQKNKLNPPN